MANNGTNKPKDGFDPSVLVDNPPIKPKKLPRRIYKRGQQGTFVYSPDIAIYVYTAAHGIIDIGPYMTSWTIQRNVNSFSSFSCSFDNKFSRYDRVIRRMDRIAVFVKRVEWVQIFAGYVTSSPWETIVPGDSTLEAECTLKKLYHTYWDTGAVSSWFVFPPFFFNGAWKAEDGGAAESMFRLLTQMAHWDAGQIKIQRIPDGWVEQAAKLIQKVQADEFNDIGDQLLVFKDALHALLSSQGLIGVGEDDVDSGGSSPDPHLPADPEAQWKKQKRKGQLTRGVDILSINDVASDKGPQSISGSQLYLRADAASAWNLIIKSSGNSLKGNIAVAYLTSNQLKNLSGGNSANNQQNNSSEFITTNQNEGWGTVIYLVGNGASWAKNNSATMNRYGWKSADSTGNRWTFEGNDRSSTSGPGALGYNVSGWPNASNTVSKNTPRDDREILDATNDPDRGQLGWGGNSTNKLPYSFWPTQEMESNTYIGSRAWINDVPVIETIVTLCNASNRDFMSAPNGDFIAFFPDRTGANGKEPVVLIRDIEVIDLNLTIHDDTLVTHYISVGDFFGGAGSIDMDVFYGGMVTIEMEELMEYLLGFEKNENFTTIGDWMLGRFGIRPMRDDIPELRDSGWNYCLALHRFQALWAQQWSAPVEVTFLPEIFPGMRIELADHNMALYVEGLAHSGSRQGGWTTSLLVSTPMHRVDGKWKMLRAEWPVGLEDVETTKDITQWTRPPFVADNIPPAETDDIASADDPTAAVE